ncbi:MAG: 4Fe-4S binding protein [Gemmiger sp.]|nr:4Fe-4S binding protein [Gemmiger sp.]
MKEGKRNLIQAAAALLTNANLTGFFTGKIYQGGGKNFCVPGLNCYSCPGAVGACPVGAVQAVLTGRKKGFPFYVVGLLLLFGAAFGRLICGFLCPFGLVQDLLHKIPTPKLRIPPKVDRVLRKAKYLVLVVLVVGLPLLLTDSYGLGEPTFCKYLCPVGILEGGIPLMITNPALRDAVGWLFSWKMLILVAVVVGSIVLYRPFCKYVCPLGAFYGLFNGVSLYRMKVDSHRCTHCGACERACKMQVEVTKNIDSPECIRCGACVEACPHSAIEAGFCSRKKASQKAPEKAQTEPQKPE